MKDRKKAVAAAMAATMAVSTMTAVTAYPQETESIKEKITVNMQQENNRQNVLTAANETDVQIDETNFPDSVFRKYVSEKFDKDGDDVLSEQEIAAAKILDVTSRMVYDLKGIEKLTALKELYCAKTGITELDVSKNTALQVLECNDTNIKELDVSQNTALVKLLCYNTGITELNVTNNTYLQKLNCMQTEIAELDVSKNTDLQILKCNGTKITKLDVTQNLKLEELDCDVTDIYELNVKNNAELKVLYCSRTKITKLDVSKNTGLTTLYCSNNDIAELDLSKNVKLQKLECRNTKIRSLDVSTNTDLNYFNCEEMPLVHLNIGNTAVIKKIIYTQNNEIDLKITDNTFNITDLLPEADISRIYDVSGADFDSATGIFSNYTGSQVSYSYNCGTNNGEPLVMNVTLNLIKQESAIEIKDGITKSYTGSAIELTKEDCIITGSTGNVTFTYYQKTTGDTWEEMQTYPVAAGTYKAVARIEATGEYQEAVSSEKQFTIVQAENAWESELLVWDWTYGDEAVLPTAKAVFGEVKFTYSNSENGIYTENVPSDPGVWYVKAEVKETDNWKGVTAVKSFTVSKAAAPKIVLPDNLSAVQDDTLNTVDLPQGWKWADSMQKVTVKNSTYAARLAVEDDKYDYSNVDGYNSEGHYVERNLNVSVSKGRNTWETVPSISGWTYGENAAAPNGSAKHGEIQYTYSNSQTGEFTDDVPVRAGVWYMKASVPASDDYTGLNQIVKFTIEKAIPEYSDKLPTDLTAVYGQMLDEVVLPDNFTWQDTSIYVGNVGKQTFKVTYTPNDTDNYETVKNISVVVNVLRSDNEWINSLSIMGWTYGETSNKPSAKAKFGEVTYIYSAKKEGVYTSDLPVQAGTWYVKALVTENENFAGLESEAVEFVIAPADVESEVVTKEDKTINENVSTPNTSENTENIPVTGDAASLGLWGMLLALSGSLAALFVGKRKKRQMKS